MRWDAQTTARKIILNGWGNTQAWCTGGKLSSFFKNNFINRRPSDAEQTESRPSVQDLNSLFNVAKPWFFHAPREVLVTTRRSKPTITSGKCVMDRLHCVCLLHWTTLSTIWPGSVDQSVTHGLKSSVFVYLSTMLLKWRYQMRNLYCWWLKNHNIHLFNPMGNCCILIFRVGEGVIY